MIQRHGTYFHCIDGVSANVKANLFLMLFSLPVFRVKVIVFLIYGVEWHHSYEEKVSTITLVACIRLAERRFICFLVSIITRMGAGGLR